MVENIAWLGHDSFRIGGSKTIYIDPWKLAKGAPAADLVLVTHDHGDHLSARDIAAVSTPATVVAGPAEVAKKVSGRAVTLTIGQTTTLAGVAVTPVPAYNTNKFTSPGVLFHPPGDGKLGYIIELDGRRIYHAGDTDAIAEMDGITVDVALIPVSGTYVMTAEEAARACTMLRAALVIPMHYGTLVGSVDDARRFAGLCPLPVEILEKTAP
jgi:L-ascorbate metabolism protein UlaG (beta-lactamase superfamily)